MGNAALRIIDRLDLQPRFTLADAARLNERFRGVDTQEMLRVALGEGLLGDVAVVSSFGAESAALLHLVASVDRSVPVLFLDTGKHFSETIAYRDELVRFLGLTDLRILQPDAERLAARDESGLRWSYDPDGCCEIRKVEPLARGLAGFDASFTGRKAFQAATRANLLRFELDGDRLKVNPLITWSKEELDAYFAAHDLPVNPLVAMGYPSIGCQPCTNKVAPGEDPRSGRWSGWNKTECGIHTPIPDGDPNQPVF
ncbi:MULTISPECIES: phosphoadenylyl-sulfate reductase [Sphingomonas]|uniref:phosphoadenylyl-sulfate reductase n=1 Tax=Sphingomonas TaxID=13687 RepID=UPI000F7EBE6E|nr:phosphoadenylyl-sulfate reductase [Sphingomonas sp. ABOLF]RSV15724.1 phosphoadenylyl-sulfate reductase [Sphingomonas sp. ABOLF]GLK21235.1 phosphoadenosine phosphosulfate reductase [Microbacterium terregens]